MRHWSFLSSAETQTWLLGRELGRLLTQPALILLQGDLGSGKSVFARGVARGLGVPEEVPITSPTFTLMNHYPARLDLYHFDLYRLADPEELIEIGFEEYAYGRGVALIEWPEKLAGAGGPCLRVSLRRIADDQRRIDLAADADYAGLLAALHDRCAAHCHERDRGEAPA